MTLHFSLPYRTEYGQRLVLCGSLPQLGQWELADALPLRYDEASTRWSTELTLTAEQAATGLTYKYVLLIEGGGVVWEWGDNRTLDLPAGAAYQRVEVRDFWRAPAQDNNELFTAAFTGALFRRPAAALASQKSAPVKAAKGKKAAPVAPAGAPTVRFGLAAPRVAPQHQLCVLGSDAALGNWDNTQPLLLSDAAYPAWTADLALASPDAVLRYKYGIWDAATRQVVQLETGDDRVLPPTPAAGALRVLHDEGFRYAAMPWRGAGVALPVFALRSQQGLGVGEFPDLKLLVEWAVKTGLNMVQVLPINDTTATHTWVDSYPYAAISVFALHPQYLRLEDIARLKDKKAAAELSKLRDELNAKDFVDYEAVMNAKWKFLRLLYQQEKAKFLDDPAFQHFRAEQAGWLVPYAAFSALRDRFHTADFGKWPAQFRQPANLEALVDEAAPDFDEFGLHFFTQFHLDRQLREAVDYGRQRQVVLKGDLPIGIYRHSVDAWTQPEMYHMDRQAGAPPDDFSTTGQNWRFPTYNWERMAEDNYAWWRQRLGHLARYFDALRIDHILGFFRIWEMPENSVEGLLGHFSPALPLHRDEVQRRLGWFDEGRLCAPYIRWHLLERSFGTEAQAVFNEFMSADQYGNISLRPEVGNQRAIEAYVDAQVAAHPKRAAYLLRILPTLYHFVNEVLFVQTGPDEYQPRITVGKSTSFAELDGDDTRSRLDAIYVDFFFRRHEDFWRQQGLVKLPAVRFATNMLICGEDLGMVPASVPGVMKQLGILGLNIQRMPSNPEVEFGHPADAPYLSVVSPGSHDMSTVRGWWEEDRVKTQRFFETTLGHHRQLAPFYAEPWVVREVLAQHLYSPAMWAVFPLQDLLGIDNQLRRANPHDEQINVPSNPMHFWKYRLHLPLEELLETEGLNEPLRALMAESGRGQVY